MASTLSALRQDLHAYANPQKAKVLQSFFKTGSGQYGEGDVFLGVVVPETRKVAIRYKDLPLFDVESLLRSPVHEERLCALLLLVHNYRHGDKDKKEEVYRFYLRSTPFINNWDLVDLSAGYIVGPHLYQKDTSVLYKLVASSNIWERRIAVLSTFYFIKQGDFDDTFKIAGILLQDSHDLMHKAVGWMLREVGKKDQAKEEQFLRKHYKDMPRTMLRYAIERFPEKTRQAYLKGKI